MNLVYIDTTDTQPLPLKIIENKRIENDLFFLMQAVEAECLDWEAFLMDVFYIAEERAEIALQQKLAALELEEAEEKALIENNVPPHPAETYNIMTTLADLLDFNIPIVKTEPETQTSELASSVSNVVENLEISTTSKQILAELLINRPSPLQIEKVAGFIPEEETANSFAAVMTDIMIAAAFNDSADSNLKPSEVKKVMEKCADILNIYHNARYTFFKESYIALQKLKVEAENINPDIILGNDAPLAPPL